MPRFLHYITVLIENSTLLSEYGRFLTAIFYSVSLHISKDSAKIWGPPLDDIFGLILNCISQHPVGMFFRGTWAGDRYGKAPQ